MEIAFFLETLIFKIPICPKCISYREEIFNTYCFADEAQLVHHPGLSNEACVYIDRAQLVYGEAQHPEEKTP